MCGLFSDELVVDFFGGCEIILCEGLCLVDCILCLVIVGGFGFEYWKYVCGVVGGLDCYDFLFGFGYVLWGGYD